MANRVATTALSQLCAWAGETVFKRGQSYELRGRVRELAATAEGGLIAWVQGNERYATRVSLRMDQLASAELVALLIELGQRFPEVRDALAVRQMLASDDAKRHQRGAARRGAALVRPARQAQINDDSVADAVARAYPNRAAAIWQSLAEVRIAQTSPAAYEEAALFLRKLRRVWTERGKLAEWRAYVEELRAANRRKRRLVETLLRERG